MSPRRRRQAFLVTRIIRATVVALLAIVVIGALAYAAAWLLIDPNAYKPAIQVEVLRATGRVLTLRGPLHLGLGLTPTLVAEDVALANPAGLSRPDLARPDLSRPDFSRPEMLTVAASESAFVTPLSIASELPIPDTNTFPVPKLAEAPESSSVPPETVVPPA